MPPTRRPATRVSYVEEPGGAGDRQKRLSMHCTKRTRLNGGPNEEEADASTDRVAPRVVISDKGGKDGTDKGTQLNHRCQQAWVQQGVSVERHTEIIPDAPLWKPALVPPASSIWGNCSTKWGMTSVTDMRPEQRGQV